ncbi:MAG: hypothetical protein HFI34_00235 [Lachnospiraceae bacterium]|nr:hypothetical protein [Lachnospiraceae bacterium]
MTKQTNKPTAIFLTVILTLSLMLANFTCIYAEESPEFTDVNREVSTTAGYLLNALNTTEISPYNYKEVILILRSGIDSGDLADRYCNLLESNITDGRLLINGSENITMYAAYLIVLALHGSNALDVNGNNMAEAFDQLLASYATAEELNTAVENPYYYDFIVPAVFAYEDYMEHSDTIKTLLQNAIMINYKQTETGCGIDYWGISGDNNAAVLPALNYFSDHKEIADAIADAITFNESLIMEDGGSRFDNGEYSTTSNANSTGAALYLYSLLKNENNRISYNALLNFKSILTPGAYTYFGEDNMFATVDALKGLIAYKMLMDNEGFPFDVTNEVTRILSPEQPEETSGQDETTTADSFSETDSTADTTVSEINTDTTTAIPDKKTPETTTASNSSAKTGENGSMTVILLTLCILSTGAVMLTRKSVLTGK